jgi:hypothetical protein
MVWIINQNYNKTMSYENPTRAIDTQTGQHLANLQNTISGTFQGIAKTYKAEQEARTKELNEQAEIITNIKKSNQALEDNLRNKMSEFGAQNPSLNTDAWLAAVDRVNDIKNTIDLGTASPKEIAALRQELSEIMALPTLGRTMLENLTQSVVGFDKVLNNVGKMGGADLYSGSTMIEDLRVWQNLSPGERKQVIQKNPKNGKWEASIVINGNQYTSDQLSRLTANGEGLIAIVSDQTSNFDNYTNMVKPKDEKTGEDKFRDGVLGPIEYRDTEDGNAESYRVVNKEVVKKTAGIEIDASISVMTASEKAVFWNNILAKKGSGNKIIVNSEDPRARSMSSEDFDDPKNEELFKEAYTDKWIDSRIGAEVILSSKRIETKELTPAQQLAQNKNKEKEEAEQEQFDFDVKTAIWNKPINMENLLTATGKLGLDMNAEAVTNEEGEIVAYSVINKKEKGKTTINKSDTNEEVTKKLLMALGYNTKRISETDIWGIRSTLTNKNKGAGDELFK